MTHPAGAALRRFIITESEAGLTSHAGLGLIGMALNERTNRAGETEGISALRSDAVSHASVLTCYVALLCLGKSGVEAINGFREDAYSAEAVGLERVPSEGIRRRRTDAFAADYKAAVENAAIESLHLSGARLTALDNGLMPLDCDVTPFDNSQSKQEGVSRTCKGEDGYAPLAGSLGQEGSCPEPQLRPGSQHCHEGTPEFLQRVLGRARQLTAAPLLLRPTSGRTPRLATMPLRAKRRRIRTVMQALMYPAARLTYTGRRVQLAFGFGCAVVTIFRCLYCQLAGP